MAIQPPSPGPAGQATALAAKFIQPLLLDSWQHPRGQAHLSAASGLVCWHQRLYVVADDELHLGVFDDIGIADVAPAPGTLFRLLDGVLPKGKGLRKNAKPDFESLALLPALPGCPTGALLALGSGSRPNREVGVLVALDAHGAPSGGVAMVDLAALYAPLRQRFGDLNIEGALLVGDELFLLQRGNQGHALNACIRYEWNLVAPYLTGLQAQPPAPRRVHELHLGSVQGVPLGLTDGAALHGGAWAFSAVSERTVDSYQDGACVGSAIGIVGPDGQLQQLHMLEGAPKVEGIAVQFDAGDWVFTLVTDADNPTVASQLLQVRVPRQDGYG